MKILLSLFFLTLFAQAENSLVQVPDACIENKISPCLVKAKARAHFQWIDTELDLVKDTLLELHIEQDNFRIDVLSGFAKVQSSKAYKVSGYDVKTNQAQYIAVQSGALQIFDTQSLDLKTLIQEVTISKKDRVFVLQKSEFLSRTQVVQYLAQFFSDKKSLKSVLAGLSVAYQNKLTSESSKQAVFLKKNHDREIASIEFAEKERIAQALQRDKDRKRSRELFFMRTFKQ